MNAPTNLRQFAFSPAQVNIIDDLLKYEIEHQGSYLYDAYDFYEFTGLCKMVGRKAPEPVCRGCRDVELSAPGLCDVCAREQHEESREEARRD